MEFKYGFSVSGSTLLIQFIGKWSTTEFSNNLTRLKTVIEKGQFYHLILDLRGITAIKSIEELRGVREILLPKNQSTDIYLLVESPKVTAFAFILQKKLLNAGYSCVCCDHFSQIRKHIASHETLFTLNKMSESTKPL